MSLFPAYAQDSGENDVECTVACVQESNNVSPSTEAQLLESDSDEESKSSAPVALVASEPCSTAMDSDDYYIDRKFDCGNLRVSTLYYPGRPQYETQKHLAMGVRSFPSAARHWDRYFEVPSKDPYSDLEISMAEVEERISAYLIALIDNQTDESFWLKFVFFQERYASLDAAMAVARDADNNLGLVSPRIRAEKRRLQSLVIPPNEYIVFLRDELKEKTRKTNTVITTETWLHLFHAVAASGFANELDVTAAAALAGTRAVPTAYPQILYVYGGYLRSAGLWERLVLLLELVTSMNFGPSVFPPPIDRERQERMERVLHENEDTVINSGLPLTTVWVRVERARAAAHWRPGETGSVEVDPQRVPLPADIAELLLPVHVPSAQMLLLVNALRLAKVPVLPSSDYAHRATDVSNNAFGDDWLTTCGEAFLPLIRASRRLPLTHPARARPKAATKLLALFVDPPHYFSDDTGYLSWVSSLWEACCNWTSGSARVAIVCWWLRWLHAILLLDSSGEGDGTDESRRIRNEARGVLKQWAGSSPLPFAQFARLERAAAGVAPARRAALKALRAALQDPAVPPTHRLYVARVATEICDELESNSGTWATVCAVLDVPMPIDERLSTAPPSDMRDEALNRCEKECAKIEKAQNACNQDEISYTDIEGPLEAMLPGDGEWAAARARLASARRREELAELVANEVIYLRGATAVRYWEHSACALVMAAAREHRMVITARKLAPLFPHNAFLALAVSSGGQFMQWQPCTERNQLLRAFAHSRTHVGALAHLFKPLLRACESDWDPQDAAHVVIACERAGRDGAGGALLGAVRIEAEARAPRPRPEAALLAATSDHPYHKWLYVRGAAWCPAEAPALADVLLERGLRTHALRDELVPIQQ